MPSVNAAANGAAGSPEAEAEAAAAPKTKTVPSPTPSAAAAATKGHGLRRWRRIRRDQERPREDWVEGDAHHHRRWLPLAAAAGASRGKHDAFAAAEVEAESSTAEVESRLVPPPPIPVPDLGFSVGAGSGTSEDRGSRYSTAASAPRVPLPRCDRTSAVLSPREWGWDRPRTRAATRNPRASRPWAGCSAAVSISTEAGCSRSSVDSDLCSSNAVLKARRQLGHRGGNGSGVAGRSARFSAAEESVGSGDNGRMYSGAHLWTESILMLQRAQEALENEVEKFMAIGNEPSGEFDVHDDEWSGSGHVEEPNEDLLVRIKHLESRLEEASALLREKVSRIYELEAICGPMQSGKTTRETTNLLLSQCELDQLYQERMESEIQCVILTRAYQASTTLSDDQMTLYQTQKSLYEDYKLLGLKLQHTESRAMVLEEMTEKLQLQCKELSNGSEVLQLQYKATRVWLVCFVQILLLCIAMGTYLMRLSPSCTKVVPT